MIKININIESMDVYQFNTLCMSLGYLRFDFQDIEIMAKNIKIKGDFTHMSEISKKYYRKMVAKGCVDNLKVIKK